MKKTVLMIMAFCACLSLFSNQLTLNSSSQAWRLLTALYRLDGRTYHNVVTPIAQSSALWLADQTSFSGEFREYLEEQEPLFTAQDVSIDCVPFVSYAGLLVTSPLRDVHELSYPVRDIPALMGVDASFCLGERLAAEMRLDLVRTPDAYVMGGYGDNFSLALSDSDFDFFRPHKAYVSYGTESLGILIARDRLSASNGFTGNLVIGDNFMYQDFIKLSALFPFISYDMTLSSFCRDKGTEQSPQPGLENPSWDEFHPTVLNHRMSFNLGKLAVTLLEGVMNYTDNPLGDPRILNPFNILHNQFTFRNLRINNYFSVELDWAIKEGLSMSFQGFFDQIQLPFESVDRTPNSFAFLINGSYTFRHRSSAIVTCYAEAVYTSPSCYLKDTKTLGASLIDHSVTDLILGNKATGFDDIGFMGYREGCDVIVAALGFSAINPGKLDLEARLMYTVHGEKRMDYASYGYPDAPVMSPDEPKFIWTPSGAVKEHSIQLRGSADWKVSSILSLQIQGALIQTWNRRNQAGSDILEAQLGFAVTLEGLKGLKL